ncbi:hypothetical protein SISSUDRAFT_530263 [Sistotremastrum suecicum HHB10207 ss-3]|uniref:Cleavage/polyadenylation specificity factor A subunit N-terminal domain-containing protein n=1 Tax=Sistotremastrum suecicum HHB10207 ss-3 TaxID=1314776 RepID=A0A166F337_9AGAM|nr:hypothetical protein SISSUDRAFT_530263 [Sistotremastrum suecicum HHB10207 ss-3]
MAQFKLEYSSSYAIDYQSSPDKSSLIIAAHASRTPEGDVLLVREVYITRAEFGKTKQLFRAAIPATSPNFISIQDPYVMVLGQSTSLFIDWRGREGLSVLFLTPPGHPRLNFVDITELLFHPTQSIILVLKAWRDETSGSGIFLGDLPSDLPVIPPESSSDLSHWTSHVRKITVTELPRAIFPFKASFDGTYFPIGFRNLVDLDWVLDLVVLGVYEDEMENNNEESLEGMTHSNLDELSTQTIGDNRIPGVMFFILKDSGGCQILTPEFGNGSGHGLGWIELNLPQELTISSLATGSDVDGSDITSHFKAVFPAFDVATRRLYISSPKGLHMLQF